MYEFGNEPSLVPRYVSPQREATGWQRTHVIRFYQKRIYYEVPTPNFWHFGLYQQFANGNAMFVGRVSDVDGTLWSILNPNNQGTFSEDPNVYPGGTIFTHPWFGWRYAGIWDVSNNAVTRHKMYGQLTLFSYWPRRWSSMHGQV